MTAASGPVGSAVGQIARTRGARAVGIAGRPDKCAYGRDKRGFDDVVDHRRSDLRSRLAAATPTGIDVPFGNVGGAVWTAVLPLLNEFASVPVCGLVAHDTDPQGPAGPDRTPEPMNAVLTRSLKLRGFIQREFVREHFGDFLRDMTGRVADGSVRYHEDVVDGLESAPEAFAGPLRGHNFGTLLVQVAPDPTRG